MVKKYPVLLILLLITLLITVLSLFFDCCIYYLVLLIYMLLVITGITLFLLDFIIQKYNKKDLKKIIAYFLVGGIVLIANNPWCYMSAIIILVFDANLIDEHCEKFIKDCLLANKGVVNASNEELTHKDEEEMLEDQNNDNDDSDNNKPSLDDVSWKKHLKSGIIKYNEVGDLAIKNLSTKLGVNFEINKKLNGKLKPLYPDGFIRLPNMDYLVEVKTTRSNDINRLLDNSVRAIKNYREFYIDNLPKINATFYLLLVVNKSFIDNNKERFSKKFFEIFKSDEKSSIYNYKLEFISIEKLK